MGIIKNLRALKKSLKVAGLADALYYKGAFNLDEKEALMVISSYYYFRNIKKEEELVGFLEDEYDYLHRPFNLYKESLKGQRRVVIRLLLPGFRKRMFDFCLDRLIPFAEKTKFLDLMEYLNKYYCETKHKA